VHEFIAMKAVLIFSCFLLVARHSGAYASTMKNNLPHLHDHYHLTEDGVQLPIRRWLPKTGIARAVLVALHGFNDYSYFFQQAGNYLSQQGIACLAYDQRGFGATDQRGLWAGNAHYAADLISFTRLVKQHYPNIPLYVLGESMGAAIVIIASPKVNMPEADGIILAAPAVWSKEAMPWYQNRVLWLLAHTMPWLKLSGEGIRVKLTDNLAVMDTLNYDPLMIRQTRMDALYGLTHLMDIACAKANTLNGKILVLYGERDGIIPKPAMYDFLQRFLLAGTTAKTVGFYPQGYHLLLRDVHAKIVWQDIAAWINSHGASGLPSGADEKARQQMLKPLHEWRS
jgi:alpha-beta hydrolase superfamily lysophospholipase